MPSERGKVAKTTAGRRRRCSITETETNTTDAIPIRGGTSNHESTNKPDGHDDAGASRFNSYFTDWLAKPPAVTIWGNIKCIKCFESSATALQPSVQGKWTTKLRESLAAPF